jgi:putative 4-mercaptohistidine N1-methyltranferase
MGAESSSAAQVYESDRSLGEYLLFHYGSAEHQFPWENGPKDALHFPTRSVLELMDQGSKINTALDLGCAVGKSSFVLADFSREVLGIDYSKSFIGAAQTILEKGRLDYQFHEEGTHWVSSSVRIDQPPRGLSFEVGDACKLPSDIGTFDLVHAANLLCRLPDPMALLSRLPELVQPGGQLLLTTPLTWLEEFTPREHWLGEGDSASALKNILQESFDLEVEKNLPFLIREHRRKFQYTIALGMRWRKKAS